MCIFCDIAEGKIPSKKVYEDDLVLAFDDINPIAPVHTLIIPKKHFDDVIDLSTNDDGTYLKACMETIGKVASAKNIESGFRVINNCREDGGQTVMHVHFHVIGGVKLTEKML
ncbi:MAG: histidine triad nucleotide-binding protein [Clostridia bacterium]|nr:histidine triad nucleotide-binding protein [Clostridia bacterium]